MNWDKEEERFQKALFELEHNPEVLRMKDYPQHKITDCYTHCHNVAVTAFYFARKWNWEVHVEDVAMGAMLHDFYLYDIREKGLNAWQHGKQHPAAALENAEKYFDVNDRVKNIILSHMWPLPYAVMHRSREALLVGLADKYCAFEEMQKGVIHIEDVLKKA